VGCGKGRHAGGRRAAGQAWWRAGARARRRWGAAAGGCLNACPICWIVGIHNGLGNAAAAAGAGAAAKPVPPRRRGGKAPVFAGCCRACCCRACCCRC
jgi:hypothetical protein